MTNRSTLKGYFNTGDKPTEAQFADLIDSTVNITEDFGGYESKVYTTDVVVSDVEQNVPVLEVGDNWFLLESFSGYRVSVIGSGTGGFIYLNDSPQLLYNDIITYGYNVYGNESVFGENLYLTTDPLPDGVTALTVRVVIKGFLIPKS